MIGRSPRNGIWRLVRVRSRRKRPARKFVSPSFSRMLEVIVRVPMIGSWPPSCAVTNPFRLETSTVSFSVISWLWWTRGSTSILMPTSWY